MAWQGIEGHDAIVEQFRTALARGRLASTFLFTGPAGVGKRSLALRLAQLLLCPSADLDAMRACGTCDSCGQVSAETHPDLHLVSKPADKGFIPLAAFIGDESHRMRAGLCHAIALKPMMGGRRIAVIDDADYLNEEGANSLLKTLEEPPPRSVLILIATSAERQLPTIRSRCQIVRFGRLPEEAIGRLLVEQGIVPDAETVRRVANFADGSLERARELADADLWTFRGELLRGLARKSLDSVSLAASVEAFVNEAGKDAGPRRARLRQVIAMAHDFFRAVLRATAGLATSGDQEMQQTVATAPAHLGR